MGDVAGGVRPVEEGGRGVTWEELKPSSRAVVAELLLHGPLSRADLARRLGYSGASLTKLSTPLLEDGIIVDGPARPSAAAHNGAVRRGRRSFPLDVAVESYPIIGIKLTGDELFAVRTDLRATIDEELQSRFRSPEPSDVLDAIDRAIASLDPDDRVRRIGISLAGKIRVGDSHVRDSMFLGWDDVPLADLVRARTGREVILANDVRALAAAQHWFGAAKGSECFAVLAVGAGVGCALVANNGVLAGNGGLVAHIPIKQGGPLCSRGHRGCASSYLSLDGIVRTIQLVSGDRVRDIDDCLELAADGYPPALAVFSDACFALGVMVAHVTNMLGPDRVILSGEGMVIYDINPGALQEGIDSAIDADAGDFEVIVRPFNFMEWSRGAAVIAIQSLIRPPGFIIN
jgi:predicted NBD/HSP70 family sugar kinase